MKGLQQMFGITFDRKNNSYKFNQTTNQQTFLINSIRQANPQTGFADLIRQKSLVIMLVIMMMIMLVFMILVVIMLLIMMMTIMPVTLGNLKHRQTHKGGDWTGHKALNLRPLMMTRFLLSQINLRPLMMTHPFKLLITRGGVKRKYPSQLHLLQMHGSWETRLRGCS